MKISLIALVACCAVATPTLASIGGMDEPAPRYTVTDLPGVHPPRLNDQTRRPTSDLPTRAH